MRLCSVLQLEVGRPLLGLAVHLVLLVNPLHDDNAPGATVAYAAGGVVAHANAVAAANDVAGDHVSADRLKQFIWSSRHLRNHILLTLF